MRTRGAGRLLECAAGAVPTFSRSVGGTALRGAPAPPDHRPRAGQGHGRGVWPPRAPGWARAAPSAAPPGRALTRPGGPSAIRPMRVAVPISQGI